MRNRHDFRLKLMYSLHIISVVIFLATPLIFINNMALSQSLDKDFHDKDHFTIFIRAFIPPDVIDSIPIPNSNGTMVSVTDKWLKKSLGCFDTDQRDFSNEYDASYRIQVGVSATSRIGSESFSPSCGLTIKRDCNSGKEEKRKSCDPSESINYSYKMLGRHVHQYYFSAAAANPLVPLSSFLRFQIRFDLLVREEWRDGKVYFTVSGKVGDFPAFEGYIEFNGERKTLFNVPPLQGATPWSLRNKPTFKVQNEVYFVPNPR